MIKIKFTNKEAKKLWKDGEKFNKTNLNAGFDIYTTEVDSVHILNPGEIKMFSTGICIQSDKFHFLVRERGSTGSKGLAVRAGVIDANYTGEVFIAINNTSNKKIIIGTPELMNTFAPYDKDAIYYDINKGIAQIIPIPILAESDYKIEIVKELDKTDRGDGKLGSTGK